MWPVIAFYSKCNGKSLENFSRKAVDQAVFKMVQKVSRLYVGGHREGSQETSQEDTTQIQVREAGGLGSRPQSK